MTESAALGKEEEEDCFGGRRRERGRNIGAQWKKMEEEEKQQKFMIIVMECLENVKKRRRRGGYYYLVPLPIFFGREGLYFPHSGGLQDNTFCQEVQLSCDVSGRVVVLVVVFRTIGRKFRSFLQTRHVPNSTPRRLSLPGNFSLPAFFSLSSFSSSLPI